MAAPMFCPDFLALLKGHLQSCTQCRGTLQALMQGLPLGLKMFLPSDAAEQLGTFLEQGNAHGTDKAHDH